MKYKTIKDVYEACKNDDVDESKLEIIVDSDYTGFCLSSDVDGEDDDMICRGNGEDDVTELYRLLFPKAVVDRC